MRLECEALGQSIRAEALRLDEGWDVSVFGGSRSHVGAVTLAEADGSVQTLLRRDHRDDAVSVRWAQALAVVITVVISVGFGMIGTLFEQLLQLPRIFVSIGLSTVYQGIAYVITNAKTISSLPPAFKAIGQGTIFHPSLTYATIFMIVAGIFMSFIMDRTYFGRYVFALGGNEAASRLAGINIKRMKYAIGGIAGLFCGIGAVILTFRVGAAAAGTAAGTEITVLTGVLVGGVSVRGGEGKIANCVAGVLIMGLLANGMQLAGLNTYYQYVAKGAIMLLVMWFDAFKIKRRAIASNKRKEERVAA